VDGNDFVRGLGFALVLAIGLVAATAARAGALTPDDLAWLNANLNLAADSPVIQTLTETQQERLHGLIGAAKTGADRKRQAVVNFITKVIGDSLEETLEQARGPLPPAPPTELGANGRP
jgi:hypothetical protein